MRSALTIRILLIAIVAIFSGPRPSLAALTDGVVICGLDGVSRSIVFDFETGAPATPDKAFERCPLCIAFAPPGVATALATPDFAEIGQVPRPAAVTLTGPRAPPIPPARAPPALKDA